MYKHLPTSTRPLPLAVSSKTFTDEWLLCIGDYQKDLTSLLLMMEPVFIYWEKQLTREIIEDDINFLTLCKLISKEPEEALAKIKRWRSWVKSNSDIKSELQYIFIERVRKLRYKPTFAQPLMVEYIVAKDFKLGLYHHIRYILRLVDRDAIYNVEEREFDIAVTFDLPDYLLLQNIGLNIWQSYLFHLIKQGYNSITRSVLTKLHRRNLYNEERKIWLRLKQMQ